LNQFIDAMDELVFEYRTEPELLREIYSRYRTLRSCLAVDSVQKLKTLIDQNPDFCQELKS
jgi:hypothetical protein